MSKLAFVALLGLAATCVAAKDLGVLGTTWPIVEVDARQMLVEDAIRTDWEPAQAELKDSAKKYLENLPKRAMPSPQSTQTLWVDPSVMLASDIQAPVKQPDGSLRWQVLAAKGSVVNPLVRFRPVTAFLLFDGSDEQQMALVRDVLKTETTRIVPVEAGAGSMKQNAEMLKRPVYHASDAMLSRFQVQYLPTLVYPGFGARELFLGTTSYATPYQVAQVLQTWPSLGYGAPPVKETAP